MFSFKGLNRIKECDDEWEYEETGATGAQSLFLYFCIFSLSLILYEMVIMQQLGSVEVTTFLFLLFIPAEALIFTLLCGIGNRISSLILLPVIELLSAAYYIVQTVYIANFGTLFSISMMGMGTDAMGNFGWAVTDSVKASIPRIIILLLPTIITIICISIRPIREFFEDNFDGRFIVDSYGVVGHLVVIAICVVTWFGAVGFMRLFGTERPSPYYLLTSSNVTTDASARKLGTFTTAMVEGKSYFFSDGADSDSLVLNAEDDYDSFTTNKEYDFFASKGEDDISNSAHVDDDGTPVIVINDDGVKRENEEAKEVESIPWINKDLDFEKVAENADDEVTENLATFFANRKPSTTNEYTGMFEGYNLIYICAESFWNYACNETVTPTLYKMTNNGIVLNNYYNSFFNTTTNGEYAFSTGLWPDVSRNSKNGTDVGSFAQSASKYMPQGLGDLFTEQGIPSYAFHNYYGEYYRRSLSWPNLGYECRFTGDDMYFTSNWPASDLELMEQTVDDYIYDEQFNAYYMTFSGHGPFTSKNYMFNKNINEVTKLLGEDEYNVDARGYFCGELEFDKAMEYLLERLEEEGQLDKTVIVIAADHYPYYLSDEGLHSLTKKDEIDTDFDIYKSSCIIYNAGLKEPINVDSYCSNIDILPTILNLFNIPFDSRLMMGRDIFSKEAHNRATLYNMSFITDFVKYNYETGEAMWTKEGKKLSEEEKEKYLDSQLANIENEYNVSCKIISDNFFLTAYEESNILSSDEVATEKERERKVVAKDEALNQQDDAKEAAKELEKQQELEAQQFIDMMNQEAAGGIVNDVTGNGVVFDNANPDNGQVNTPNAGLMNEQVAVPDENVTNEQIAMP